MKQDLRVSASLANGSACEVAVQEGATVQQAKEEFGRALGIASDDLQVCDGNAVLDGAEALPLHTTGLTLVVSKVPLSDCWERWSGEQPGGWREAVGQRLCELLARKGIVSFADLEARLRKTPTQLHRAWWEAQLEELCVPPKDMFLMAHRLCKGTQLPYVPYPDMSAQDASRCTRCRERGWCSGWIGWTTRPELGSVRTLIPSPEDAEIEPQGRAVFHACRLSSCTPNSSCLDPEDYVERMKHEDDDVVVVWTRDGEPHTGRRDRLEDIYGCSFFKLDAEHKERRECDRCDRAAAWESANGFLCADCYAGLEQNAARISEAKLLAMNAGDGAALGS